MRVAVGTAEGTIVGVSLISIVGEGAVVGRSVAVGTGAFPPLLNILIPIPATISNTIAPIPKYSPLPTGFFSKGAGVAATVNGFFSGIIRAGCASPGFSGFSA